MRVSKINWKNIQKKKIVWTFNTQLKQAKSFYVRTKHNNYNRNCKSHDIPFKVPVFEDTVLIGNIKKSIHGSKLFGGVRNTLVI